MKPISDVGPLIAGLNRICRVVTVDRTDFAIYRRNGRDAIPILCPPES